jgi:pyruvate,water dikinase
MVRFGPHTFRSQLEALLARSVGPDAVAEIDAILSHVQTLTSETVEALAHLARHVRAHPGDAGEMLASPAPADPAPSPTVVAFHAEFRKVLDRFSLRADAWAFTVGESCQPGWRDRPNLPLAIIARYATQDLDLLAGRKAAAIIERDTVVERIRAGIPDDGSRASFDRLLQLARREVAAYENHNHAIDASASALLWRARNAVAKRLQSLGVLESADEVVWLSRPEIDAALRAPTSQIDAVRWFDLVGARRALNRWQAAMQPPDWLGAPKDPDAPEGLGTDQNSVRVVGLPPEGVLAVGQPGSRGRATGRVRHVPPDAEVPEVEPGDVLVARNAGALWSPVLPLAAAVVLEEGALLQHAMLICREFAVPGVVQAKGARSRLAEGALVIVDGTNGWVTVADAEP